MTYKPEEEIRIHYAGEETMHENNRMQVPNYTGHTIDQRVWVVSFGKYNRKHRVFTNRTDAANFAVTMEAHEPRVIEAQMEKDLS